MSGAGVDSGTINGLLKQVYDDEGVTNLQNMDADTRKRLTKSTKKPTGAGFIFSVNVQGNQRGKGNQNELESLRQPDSQTPVQGTIKPKVFTHTIRFSGLSLEIAQTDVDSFADNATFQMDEGMKDAGKELNAQIFRSGSGVLATVNGAVSASTTVPFQNGCPTHFRVGMYLDFFNGSTREAASIQVTAVDIANSQLTMASAVTLTSGDNIFRERTNDNSPTDGKEYAGLKLAVDDGSIATTYENISTSTYTIWKGIIFDAGAANVSDDLLQRIEARKKIFGGRKTTKIISNTSGLRKYLSVVTPLKRFEKGATMDSGMEEMPTWNGIEWIVDVDCEFDRIYFVTDDYFKKYEVKELGFDENGGGIMKWDPGYDGFVAYAKEYANYGSQDRRNLACIKNLALATF